MRELIWQLRLWWNDICPKHGPFFSYYCSRCDAEEHTQKKFERVQRRKRRTEMFDSYNTSQKENLGRRQ